MATTRTCGKRRRRTERNSNPDICGMFRSEMISAGTWLFICNRASKPFSAQEISYPLPASSIATVERILRSSSTIRIRFLGVVDIGDLLNRSCATVRQRESLIRQIGNLLLFEHLRNLQVQFF